MPWTEYSFNSIKPSGSRMVRNLVESYHGGDIPNAMKPSKYLNDASGAILACSSNTPSCRNSSRSVPVGPSSPTISGRSSSVMRSHRPGGGALFALRMQEMEQKVSAISSSRRSAGGTACLPTMCASRRQSGLCRARCQGRHADSRRPRQTRRRCTGCCNLRRVCWSRTTRGSRASSNPCRCGSHRFPGYARSTGTSMDSSPRAQPAPVTPGRCNRALTAS